MFKKSYIATLITLASGSMVALNVNAAGFALNDHSATASGNALAGAAAGSADISYSYWNPALFTNADKATVYISGAYLAPSMDVTVNSASKSSLVGGQDVTSDGKPKKDIVDSTVIPSIYLAVPFSENTIGGVSLNVPFGLSGEYGKDWAGRYHSSETAVKDLALSFSLAHKVSNWASVGGSIQIHDASVLLAAAIPSTSGTDGYGELEGDDIATSYSIGVLLEPIDGTRLGIGYRSDIDYTFEGKAKYSNIDPAVASAKNIEDGVYLYDEITFPSVLTLSLEQDISQSLKFSATAMKTGWSSLDEMRIAFGEGDTPGTQADSVLTFKFEDQWFYSAGLTYEATEKLTLRTGYAKDNSPVKDEYRSARTPDGDRTWISVGATYDMTPDTSFTFAYTNVSIEDVTVNRDGTLDEDSVRGKLNADYKSSADVFSLAMNMAF